MRPGSLSDDLRDLGERTADLLGQPMVRGLYLPAAVADETFRDEFGFVLLADGSVGPFYVSLGDLLRRLWRRYPDPAGVTMPATDLLQGLAGRDTAGRALALGAYNALSAALFRATGFEPPDRLPAAVDHAPGPVGMVGYFCPVVDRLTAQGREVLVLERAPERVPRRAGVSVTTDRHDLRHCAEVLCTASTLVNDSLEALLDSVDPQARFELIGPSGSGLPDPLFTRGVSAVGGVRFAHRDALLDHLERGESWGSAGRKYQLEPHTYPGFAGLTARLTAGRA